MTPGDFYEVEHDGAWLPVAFFLPIPGHDLSGGLALSIHALALVDGRFKSCPGRVRERTLSMRVRDINREDPRD